MLKSCVNAACRTHEDTGKGWAQVVLAACYVVPAFACRASRRHCDFVSGALPSIISHQEAVEGGF